MRMWRRVILRGGVALLFAGLGVLLGGAVAQRVGFNGRGTAAVSRHGDAGSLWRTNTATGKPWSAHIQRVDRALAERDPHGAEQAWDEAHRTALQSRRWEGMVEIGDASLRIGEYSATRKAAEAKARKAYLAALFQARQERSLEGVLRTAEAFGGLGDREVVHECLRIAEELARQSRDPDARDRVRAFRERSAAQWASATSLRQE